jgi:hypothetical protein
MKVLPNEIIYLEKLEKLKLTSNSLSELPKDFHKHWTSLDHMDISFNNFENLPDELGLLPKLKILHTHGNFENSENSKCLEILKQKGTIVTGHLDQYDRKLEFPDEIYPGLFLGDYPSAMNKHNLQKLHITHVLTVAYFTPLYPHEFRYKVIEVEDTHNDDLLNHFDSTFEFIEEGRKSGGVLVHWYEFFEIDQLTF